MLKNHGVPVVLVLEGGGYYEARDPGSLGEKVFSGLQVKEVAAASSTTAASPPVEHSAPGGATCPASLFEGPVYVSAEAIDESLVVERKEVRHLSVFGANFQTVSRVLTGQFDWDTFDPMQQLRNLEAEMRHDIADLWDEPMGSESREDRKVAIVQRGAEIQQVISGIYWRVGLYAELSKPTKKQPKQKKKRKTTTKAGSGVSRSGAAYASDGRTTVRSEAEKEPAVDDEAPTVAALFGDGGDDY